MRVRELADWRRRLNSGPRCVASCNPQQQARLEGYFEIELVVAAILRTTFECCFEMLMPRFVILSEIRRRRHSFTSWSTSRLTRQLHAPFSPISRPCFARWFCSSIVVPFSGCNLQIKPTAHSFPSILLCLYNCCCFWSAFN